LPAYATLLGAALAAPVIPGVDAAIIYSGPVNINIPSDTTGIYLNLVTGLFNPNPALVPGWDLNPWGSMSLNFFTPTPNPGGGEMIGSGSNYFNCNCETVIGPNGPFANAGSTTVSPSTPLNFNSDRNFAGFRFINEVTGQIDYGFAQISLGGSAGAQPRAIVGYWYENTGASLAIGNIFPICVPEPAPSSFLAVMAIGSIGLRLWRRRSCR